MKITLHDRFSISKRRITDEGFLVVDDCKLARTGIQLYTTEQLGLSDGGPSKVVRVYRPAEEVFDEASMRSFENVPLTVHHPREGVTAANWKKVSVGDARSIGRAGEFLTGTITIRDEAGIKALEGGTEQLSNGYTCDFEMVAGTTPDGQPFDGVQRNIRGNHVAIVDVARCGAACRVSDSQQTEKGNTMAQRKVVVDGITIDAEDSAASAIETLLKARDEARSELKIATDKLAAPVMVGDCGAMPVQALVTLALDQGKQIKELEAKIVSPEALRSMVADRSALIADAAALAPTVKVEDKTDEALRRELLGELVKDEGVKPVVDAVLAGASLADAPDALIKTAFATAKATISINAGKGNVGAKILGLSAGDAGGASTDGAETRPIGRAAVMAAQAERSAAIG